MFTSFLLFQHADPAFTDIWLGTALIIVILVTGIFSYIKESQQASIQREIERLVPRVARVVRECIETEVPAEELVLGKDYSSFGWCSYIGMYLRGILSIVLEVYQRIFKICRAWKLHKQRFQKLTSAPF